jgi:hypothetical protein
VGVKVIVRWVAGDPEKVSKESKKTDGRQVKRRLRG